MANAHQIDEFISRWKNSGGSEHANYQLFVIELTELLGVDRPNPATDDDSNDHYRFERPVTFAHTHKRTTGFIGVYRSGHFVLETKQGVNQKKNRAIDLAKGIPPRAQKRIGHGVRGTAAWDDTMLKARNQADNYARAVAKGDGWPPQGVPMLGVISGFDPFTGNLRFCWLSVAHTVMQVSWTSGQTYSRALRTDFIPAMCPCALLVLMSAYAGTG